MLVVRLSGATFKMINTHPTADLSGFFLILPVSRLSIWEPVSLSDILLLMLFPGGVCLGIVLAWRREGKGGMISVASFLTFYVSMWLSHGQFPRGPYFALIALPGFLFLTTESWKPDRKKCITPRSTDCRFGVNANILVS